MRDHEEGVSEHVQNSHALIAIYGVSAERAHAHMGEVVNPQRRPAGLELLLWKTNLGLDCQSSPFKIAGLHHGLFPTWPS